MATTGTRTTTITYSGDVTGTQTLAAASNAACPGSVEVKTLASGFTAHTVPTGGTTVTALTIVPPTGNTVSITLKGVTGDTGLRLHNTDPTTIAIDPSVTSIGITTGNTVTGCKFFWS